MSVDGTYSEMSTSVNSEASYDIDIVKHHDGNIRFKSQNFATFSLLIQLPHPLQIFWMPAIQIQMMTQMMMMTAKMKKEN